MDRPKRERRPPQLYQPEVGHRSAKSYWSLQEKEKLLEALKKHGKDDLNRLERALRPKKSKAQIAHYLQILEKRAPKKSGDEEAPIETWLRLANELTANDADYSDILASVVSICGNLEPHLPSKKASEVDYPAIYRYMECLLRGSANFPKMNELTAAILLDILQGMADTLKTLDLSVQRRLMAEKYKLLKSKVSVSNQVHYEAARKALENDIELNGVMVMTERIPYPHQVPAVKRFSRWNKRTPPPQASPFGLPASSQMTSPSTVASSSAAATSSSAAASSSQEAAAIGEPSAKRVKLLPGVKLTPGTYKLSPQDLQALLKSLNVPGVQPAPGTTMPSPPVPTRLLTCSPNTAKSGQKEDGSQRDTEVTVQSTRLEGEQVKMKSVPMEVSGGSEKTRSDLQSGAKQGSQGGDEPQVDLQSESREPSQSVEPQGDLQSGAKDVSEGDKEPQVDLQSGAKNTSEGSEEPQVDQQSGAKDVSEGSKEPHVDLQSGAKDVSKGRKEPQGDQQSAAKQTSQSGDELRNGMQSGGKQTQVQDGGVQSAANRELTSDLSQNNVTNTVTIPPGVNLTPAGPSSGTESMPNTPDGIQILDKVVVPPNQEGGKSKTAGKLPKRTSLFSLNPLCIPVRFLKPNKMNNASVVTGGMAQHPNV